VDHERFPHAKVAKVAKVRLENGIERVVNGLPDGERGGFIPKLSAFFAAFASFA
jgi:hypothetical protein